MSWIVRPILSLRSTFALFRYPSKLGPPEIIIGRSTVTPNPVQLHSGMPPPTRLQDDAMVSRHLESFRRITEEACLSTDSVVAYIASAFLMDAYPLRIHGERGLPRTITTWMTLPLISHTR